jgi:TolB-like protein
MSRSKRLEKHCRIFFARGETIDSIAVLPFVNVNGDTETEYLSDGVTDDLTNSLAQMPKLRVVPRRLAFRYKGKEVDAQKAGRDLSARSILMGRLTQRGDRLNVQTELVDVLKVSQLWGAQYNRKLADLQTVREEIATEISDRLRLRLTGAGQKLLTRRYTENTEAYQRYLKGRYYWNRRTEESLKRAIQFFNQAIEKDPNYAMAYAGLADCHSSLGVMTYLTPRDASLQAKAAAIKALELDENLAEAHTSLAFAHFRYDWDWKTFDFDHDIEKAEGKVGTVMATSPDLSAFAKLGGKLIMYHGWADERIAPGNSIDYRDRVVRLLGETRTKTFLRLYMAPGMNHGGGAGPNNFDMLTALEQWVEHGKAPSRIVASHSTDGKVDRTRLLCPYPQIAKYKGNGSTDDASNFGCKEP